MTQINTVIFDMDGLLIDSEPLWKESANEVFYNYGFSLSEEEYATTIGMRTMEFIQHWALKYKLPEEDVPFLNNKIIETVVKKIKERGSAMEGAIELVQAFKKFNYKIGVASSSPLQLIEVVVQKLDIENAIDVLTSAEDLEYGKPHPQVFLECAKIMDAQPFECAVFEDSFNGMIAAKAAKMFCIVVPDKKLQHQPRWSAADEKLYSLADFDFNLLK